MKHGKILFILIILFIAACDPLEELRDDYTVPTESFDYTLTDDDYETIADQVLYFSPDDSINAEFISTYKYFTDSVVSTDYIPYLLDNLYPGKSVGSEANVTLNYNGEMSDELTVYTSAEIYQLTPDDYETASSDFDGYFPESVDPDEYIPDILDEQIEDPEDEDIIVAAYIQTNSDTKASELAASVDETFLSDIGSFTATSISGVQNWSWESGRMAIDGWSNDYYDNDDWLISEQIDLSSSTNTIMEFVNAIDYYEEGYVTVLISEDFDGSDVTAATWDTIEVPRWETISDRESAEGQYKNTYEESGIIDLSAYDGKKVYLAFRYISTSTGIAPYWSIEQVSVGTYYWVNYDYYQYSSDAWTKMDSVYRLTASDYDNMGAPGDYDYLSSSESPEGYLPLLLDEMYPTLGNNASITLIYNYYSEVDGAMILADTYTKTNWEWVSSYSFITQTEEPYKMSTSGWVFDPTVVLTMESDDYQIIVDYVKNDAELSEQDNSAYDNSEYYYGASSYYNDFDMRSGKYNDKFDTWQDAVIEALLEAFLPTKYPDANAYSNGIEVYYVITFEVYTGSSAYYTMIFSVSKDAPDPEFEVVSGPSKVE